MTVPPHRPIPYPNPAQKNPSHRSSRNPYNADPSSFLTRRRITWNGPAPLATPPRLGEWQALRLQPLFEFALCDIRRALAVVNLFLGVVEAVEVVYHLFDGRCSRVVRRQIRV